MNTENIERELDWDEAIEHDSTFVLLPEGDYPFEVVGFERTRYQGGTKIPPCPQAKLTLRVYDAETNSAAEIQHSLFLHTKMEGLMCAFFTAIGQRKHGEKLVPNWQQVIGAHGRAHVIVDTWKGKDGNDMQSNKIKRFLEPETAAPSQQFTPGKF